ncbi:MAG: hypothetical protein R3A52_24410 [Polyangiales bacterium]
MGVGAVAVQVSQQRAQRSVDGAAHRAALDEVPVRVVIIVIPKVA